MTKPRHRLKMHGSRKSQQLKKAFTVHIVSLQQHSNLMRKLYSLSLSNV